MLYKQLKTSPDQQWLAAVVDESNINIKDAHLHTTACIPAKVHDVAWYPWSNYLLSATRSHGIELWDLNAQLWGSYVALNTAEDRLVNMISTVFSPDGQRIFSVGADTLFTHEVSRTGKPVSELILAKSLSALAIRHDDSGLKAVGSFSGEILLVGAEVIDRLELPTAVSQLHLEGWHLWASGRNDSRLWKWDLRNLTDPLCIYDRGPVASLQRQYWCLKGDDLYAGNLAGEVRNVTHDKTVANFMGSVAAVEYMNDSLIVSVGDRSHAQPSLNKITLH